MPDTAAPSDTAAPDAAAPALPQIRVRGRSFMALVLSPEAPLDGWMAALDAQVARSAAFFADKPVVLDCGLLDGDAEGLAGLVPGLLERGVRLVEIENADPAWPAAAGWTWPQGYSGGRAIGAVAIPEPAAPAAPDPARASLLVDEPVRSGQSVCYPHGDVVVMGSVASGAEVSAGGSVHVYGALRGRALAGVGGNAQARVLCRRMHAELVAVGGVYVTADDMPPALLGRPAQARLEGERLVLLPLD